MVRLTRTAAALGISVLVGLAQAQVQYPPAATVDHVDDYHGTSVADPYRWLEEYSDETNAWIEAESKLTADYLAKIPQRAWLKDRLTAVWNYERYGAPSKDGGKYFYSKNDGLQNQSVLYVTDTLDQDGRVLIDPNTLSADGTIALGSTAVTDDGSLIAYSISEAGSDWNKIRVRDVATGQNLPDEITWVKFSGASWTKDGKGFFYSRFDAPEGDAFKSVNKFHKIYFHTLGTPQDQDTLIYKRDDQPEWYLGGGVTDDGKYFVMSVNPGSKVENGIFYKDLTTPDAPVVELLNKFDGQYGFVGNEGGTFFIQTDLNSPNHRIVAINLAAPEQENWKEIIPEATEALSGAGLVGDTFFANYLKDAKSVVRLYSMGGQPKGEVQLPGIGTAGGFGGKRTDTETFYSFAGYTTPATVFRYDLTTGASAPLFTPTVDFNGKAYETKQVFYTSKDGVTKVPMFITHRKGMKLDGSNPTLLYGYGGFNIPVTPNFTPATAVFLEMGGIYCVANIRGGSEYGEKWHQGGMRLNKQNCFDDFISGAQWLIDNKYTSPKKLAIQGGSNGGLLVGACMTQRPELFGCCLPAVGVMDMLRFHTFTIGWGWVGDYGSSENPEEFKVLRSFSPYHNIRDGVCYPPTLVTTADHDDRVHPAHSFKFAARLQAAQSKGTTCGNPTLIRIDLRAGHGAGKPTSKRIEEAADVWAFVAQSLGIQTPGSQN